MSTDGILKLYRSPGIDSKESIPPAHVALARIFKHSRGARNRVGIGLLSNHTSCLLLLAAQFITGFLFGNLRKKKTSSANKFQTIATTNVQKIHEILRKPDHKSTLTLRRLQPELC